VIPYLGCEKSPFDDDDSRFGPVFDGTFSSPTRPSSFPVSGHPGEKKKDERKRKRRKQP